MHASRLPIAEDGWSISQLRGTRLIAVGAGLLAGSISLIGFGTDSFIEVTSGATLLWRMSVDANVERRERNEKLSLRIVGVCFIALAVYITYEAVSDLTRKTAPEHGRFCGSPTIRINGRDVVGELPNSNTFALSCRLYPGAKQIGLPPADVIRRAVAEAREGDPR